MAYMPFAVKKLPKICPDYSLSFRWAGLKMQAFPVPQGVALGWENNLAFGRKPS
jgi:hypothetical protein